jgi:hypothetical protein
MTQSSAVAIPEPLGLNDLSAQVAAEIAAELSTPDEIRARYKITDEQWDVMRKSPIFRDMVATAIKEFRGDLNAKKRIQLKAAIAAEDSLPQLYSMVYDKTIPAQSRIDAYKQLADLAEVGARSSKGTEGRDPGEGFTLIINFPTGPRTVEVEPLEGESSQL